MTATGVSCIRKAAQRSRATDEHNGQSRSTFLSATAAAMAGRHVSQKIADVLFLSTQVRTETQLEQALPMRLEADESGQFAFRWKAQWKGQMQTW